MVHCIPEAHLVSAVVKDDNLKFCHITTATKLLGRLGSGTIHM